MKISYFLFCVAIGLYISGCASKAIENSGQFDQNQSTNSTPLIEAELIGSHANPPRVIRAYPPQYPREAKKKGLTGTVVLTITIDEKGSVSNAEIKSTTNPIFNDAALYAVKRYKYKPAQKNGQPVSVIIDMPLSFALE